MNYLDVARHITAKININGLWCFQKIYVPIIVMAAVKNIVTRFLPFSDFIQPDSMLYPSVLLRGMRLNSPIHRFEAAKIPKNSDFAMVNTISQTTKATRLKTIPIHDIKNE